ncbi:MAG: fibronectin type III-like domain-contianing protein, partial [Bacteroidota bacterium]
EVEKVADAILHCYLPGDYGGEAIKKVLMGQVNPSGKLPFTYPRHTGSLVPYDHKATARLDTKFGYNAFNPQWNFGTGLSYSTFEYDNLQLDKTSYQRNDVVHVSVDLKNTSDRNGKEVVQVYVTDKVASITPSVRRLRAFNKVLVTGQQQAKVEFDIPVSELAFVDKDLKWTVEPGEFELTIGPLKQAFTVE